MTTTRDLGDNPDGLSTHDPTRHARYRQVAREIFDAFRRSKGLPLMGDRNQATSPGKDARPNGGRDRGHGSD